MSQGLLDPKSLEMIQNRNTLDEVVMAPSYILKDTWQIDDFCNFGHFLGLSLTNLLEKSDTDNDDDDGEGDESIHESLPYDQDLINYINENGIEADANWNKRLFRADWNLTEDNIQNELDRND